ncbi:MAG: prephenate dehydratase [Deltaproteobacteria bacterium]|nr:prephenate dehydratase [Deltaproteobacteria bacterium]
MNHEAQESPENAARLNAIRHEIDLVDRQLLELLNQRASLSLEVGRIKADTQGAIFRPQREREVLDRLSALNRGPLPDSHLRSLWREIMSSSRALQRPQRVAYLGPEGTFSHFAGLEYLGHSALFYPCGNITQIFDMVATNQCELGVVPLENSLQGTVGVSFDLFLSHEVFIQAELFSRIAHCFLSDAPALAAVRTVYSHPQPLAQCGNWLRAHVPNASLVPVESTAAAARRACGHEDAAAIGHASLSKIVGIDVLARHIEDASGNWTRFVIIGPQPARTSSSDTASEDNKTSLLFTLPDRSGALSGVLNLLATHGINMRKIESRPLKGERWKYAFFADVESNLEDHSHDTLLEKLKEACNSFRILGSYPIGPQLDRVDGGGGPGDPVDEG